jgi:ABC-type polysaccharide/polyol phosphate export permease
MMLHKLGREMPERLLVKEDSPMTAAQYCGAIWCRRNFWLSLVKVDLRRRYRRSWLGVGWSLMHPISMTIVMCMVFSQLFGLEIKTYATFVLSGLALWGFFSGAALDGCQSFFQSESYIRQHPAPLAIYPLRTTLGAAVHLGIAVAVLLPLVWATSGFENLGALWVLVPVFALLFVFAWSLAVCTATISVLFPDTQHIVNVSMQVLFYITPVIYSTQLLKERGIEAAARCNPMAAYLELFREPILHGELPSMDAWWLASAATLVALGLAVWTLTRVERRLVFYL